MKTDSQIYSEETESKAYPCKVLSGDRITIPKEIMESLNLEVGDLVMKKIKGNRLYFVPCKVVEK